MISHLKLFFKGFLMGIADVIPGVSGGTLALILGVYERLVGEIKKASDAVFKFKIFDLFKLDWRFLFPLGFGIIGAIILGSFLIPFLLNFSETYAFFLGLIVFSAFVVGKKMVKKKGLGEFSMLLLGILISFFITGLSALQSSHSLIVMFFSGAIAICAMILPGISGSFLLLLLGQYEFLLESLHNIFSGSIGIVLSFIFGAGVGILSFSQLLNFLLKKYHDLTISFLVGIMFGSVRLLLANMSFNVSEFFFVIVGAILVLGVNK